MRTTNDRLSYLERGLGWLGLLLVGLTAWASERRLAGPRVIALAGRAVLAGVALVGWTVDRLTGRSRPAERRAQLNQRHVTL